MDRFSNFKKKLVKFFSHIYWNHLDPSGFGSAKMPEPGSGSGGYAPSKVQIWNIEFLLILPWVYKIWIF